MKLGRFSIEQLSEGRFEVFSDGTINREPIDQSKQDDSKLRKSGDSARIGINPILLSDEKYKILLDTGLGWGLDAGSQYKNVSNVASNLDIFDLKPADITHVILSHLHYDHAAGSSYTNEESVTCATFPNAQYFVQRSEWEYALKEQFAEHSLKGCDYNLDDLYRLVAENRFNFLDEDKVEIIEGIEIIRTGGHTPGHQAVRIQESGQTGYYLGDLLPSEHHLNQYSMRQMDFKPLTAKKMKIQLLRNAFEEEAVLLFYHSLYSSMGRLEKDDNKKYVLKEPN
ncbi:MBL fold metallo-hydrolase [Balneolaceae bacterium YR4-1]|uniref:MBL fold metallo-hydrolase n=1 Tax=Halalkalibaculum roseum TaxID=2709311 RepID=A0A6M1SPH2_9BACT|nr:MBL fold metallo-hydrolase [Halalkalibaculum roseum]NGP76999.1 MBL fold metallo-hydrolase [Halalkalibaculum roseum]